MLMLLRRIGRAIIIQDSIKITIVGAISGLGPRARFNPQKGCYFTRRALFPQIKVI